MGRRWGLDFDEEHLRRLIRSMTPQSRMFLVLREELTKIGRWKNLPRGKSRWEAIMASRLKRNERCPIPAHQGSKTCCGRGEFTPVIKKRDVVERRIGLGVFQLADGRIRRTKSGLKRVKDDFLKAGKGCAACDLPFDEYADIELSHIESCGMNGHKRDDAIGNVTLMHKLENREQGSRSLAEYLADPKRIGWKKLSTVDGESAMIFPCNIARQLMRVFLLNSQSTLGLGRC